MACNPTEDILKSGDCGSNSGGVLEIKYFDMGDVTGYTFSSASWEVTGLTLSTTASVIEFNRNTATFTDVANGDPIAGVNFATATITIVLNRIEAAKSRALKIAGEGNRFLGIVVKTANSNYFYFPYSQLTSAEANAGTARADGSKYNVTFVAENDFLAYEVPEAIYLSL